jgi:hypothetical protein
VTISTPPEGLTVFSGASLQITWAPSPGAAYHDVYFQSVITPVAQTDQLVFFQ